MREQDLQSIEADLAAGVIGISDAKALVACVREARAVAGMILKQWEQSAEPQRGPWFLEDIEAKHPWLLEEPPNGE